MYVDVKHALLRLWDYVWEHDLILNAPGLSTPQTDTSKRTRNHDASSAANLDPWTS